MPGSPNRIDAHHSTMRCLAAIGRLAAPYALAIAAAMLGASHPLAQTWPAKPVRIIVPSPAGSPPDTSTRWLAERLSPRLGQSVVVDNRAGAGGVIGASAAARSAPDGYTLLAVHQGTLAFNPHLYAKPGYDALADFAPIARNQVGVQVIAVHPDVPANNLAEFIALARAKPGGMIFGSAGVGTPPHMAGELFQRMAAIEITHVPFKAGNFAATELIAGRVHYTFNTVAATLPHARAGKVRMLAVSSAERVAAAPDVPSIAESGLPGYDYSTWAGLCAPAGTPKDVVARLNREIVAIMEDPEARASMAALGWLPFRNDTPEAFAVFIRAEHGKWGAIIRQAGIRLD